MALVIQNSPFEKNGIDSVCRWDAVTKNVPIPEALQRWQRQFEQEKNSESRPHVENQRPDDGVINQYRRFEGAKPVLVAAGEPFVANQPDGSMQVVNERGTYTFWPHGALQVRYFDGTGYTYNPDGKGGYEYIHCGPTEKDNYSSRYDKATDSLVEINARGDVTTRWSNGSELCLRSDGTGYSRRYISLQMIETKHWGLQKEQNYIQIYNTQTHVGTVWAV